MIYKLSRLAPGSYDVLLNGVMIASLVQSGETDNATWTAELLLDLPPKNAPLPSPRQSTRSAAWKKLRSGLEELRSATQANSANLMTKISAFVGSFSPVSRAHGVKTGTPVSRLR